MMYHNDPYLNDFENRIEAARQRENEGIDAMQTNDTFDLQPPEGYESDEDSLGDLETNDSIEIDIEDSRDLFEDDEHGDYRFESDEFDGQPTEYEEWQDVYGGDDSIYEHDCDCMFDY